MQRGRRSQLFSLILASSLLAAHSTAHAADWPLRPGDLTVQQLPEATAAARVQQRQQQVNLIQPQRYDLSRYPLGDRHETHWRQTLWATAVLEPKQPEIATAIATLTGYAAQPNLTPSQQRSVQMALQVGTQLYISDPQFFRELGDRLRQVVADSPQPDWVAMALSALARGGESPDNLRAQIQQIRLRFARQGTMRLDITLHDLETRLQAEPLPPLRDLLAWQVVPQQAHLYIFCRPDRSILCRAVLKDRNGRFVRESADPDAPLWSVELLSRTLHHGLAWNFTRGESPQGIYRIEGTMPRLESGYFRAFGQFPLVKVFMPYERGTTEFLPGQRGTWTATPDAYRALLPPSWRDHFPMQQTYWAGRLGRSLIRIHGSGEPPDFFANNERFPESYQWNPTIGCFSAVELYDDSGRLQRADMPKILTALNAAGGGSIEGYLVAVEVPGSDAPVSLAEITAAITITN
ncbi:MAG: hypothetical protein HC910_00135 [Spirulinaceae cyanobacterium SM2_1_0]|nr:hypothetical protein [Spirulinaceae cyanobacterium SM2_1_0]